MEPAVVTIRPLRPADREVVLEVARALARWFRPLDQFTLAIDLAEHEGLVAEVDSRVVGFATFHRRTPDEAQLSWLGVRPEWQGRGVGSRLLAGVEHILRRQGVRRLYVFTVDETVDDPAFAYTRRFYERHGFHPVGRWPNAFGPGRHGVVLEKNLTRV